MSVNITWTQNGAAISNIVDYGLFSGTTSSPLSYVNSATQSFSVQHDSQYPIQNCGLYISAFTPTYTGSYYPGWDYNRLIWLGNNYPGTGLTIQQSYLATGSVDEFAGNRMVDLTRSEPTDIFSGSTIEILDGPASGQTSLIQSYDPIHNYFILATPFTANVNGCSYQIQTNSTSNVMTQNGSSANYPIPLLSGGGIILPNQVVTFNVTFSVPSVIPINANFAANLQVDFNLAFTPTISSL